MEVSYRRRVNISVSVKGVYTFDCTVESEGGSTKDLLIESDNLVAELKARYPVIPEGK